MQDQNQRRRILVQSVGIQRFEIDTGRQVETHHDRQYSASQENLEYRLNSRAEILHHTCNSWKIR